MNQRGRKSSAALSVVRPLPGGRYEPLESLTDEEKAVWRAVAASRPADWFSPETHSLLAEYCRATVFARQLAEELGRVKRIPADPVKFKRWNQLRTWQSRTTHLLCTLGTKMRLTQQALDKKVAAHRAVETKPDQARPWDSE